MHRSVLHSLTMLGEVHIVKANKTLRPRAEYEAARTALEEAVRGYHKNRWCSVAEAA